MHVILNSVVPKWKPPASTGAVCSNLEERAGRFPGVFMDSLNIMFNLPHGKLLEVVFHFCCCVTNCHMSSSLKGSTHWLAAPVGASAWLTGALSRAPGAPVQELGFLCLHLEAPLQGICPAHEACWPNWLSWDCMISECCLRLHDLGVFLGASRRQVPGSRSWPPSSLWLRVSLTSGRAWFFFYRFSSDQIRPIPDHLPFCERKPN